MAEVVEYGGRGGGSISLAGLLWLGGGGSPRAGLGCGREGGCSCGGLLGGRGLWKGLWGLGDLGGCSRIGGGGNGGGVL